MADISVSALADKYIARDGGGPRKATVLAPVTILDKERTWLEIAIVRGGYLPTRDRDGDKAPFLSELRAMSARGLIKGMPWRITKLGRDCLRELESATSHSQPNPEAINQIRRLAEIEQEAILSAMQIFDGNKSKAARALGISLRTVQNKLKRYGVRRK